MHVNHKRHIGPLVVLSVSLFSSVLLAVEPQPIAFSGEYVDLSGKWRVVGGDNPAFALPEWDDSRWSNTVVPQDPGDLPLFAGEAYVWFRREILLPADTRRHPLGFTLGTVWAAEVYANGTRIGSVGTWDRELREITLVCLLLHNPAVCIAARRAARNCNSHLAAGRKQDRMASLRSPRKGTIRCWIRGLR